METLLTTEALKSLVNYGVLGILAVIFLSPVTWLLWRIARKLDKKADVAIEKFEGACDSVLSNQPKLVVGLGEITRTNKELADIIVGAETNTQSILKTLVPTPDHPFSSLRLEECLLHLCGIIDSLGSKETDSEVRATVLMYAGKMRQVLERKLNSR